MDYSQYGWPLAAWVAGVGAWYGAVLLVLTKELHSAFSADSLKGVQRNHSGFIPRVGGLSIVFGVLLGWSFSDAAPGQILRVILLGGVPAFAFGFLEDVTRRVSVRTRLLATMGSGLVAWGLSGVAITDVNVPWIDPLLLWTPVAVLFTVFAVGGVANAFNLIDGFNGLAAGTAIIVLVSMGWLSLRLGDPDLATACVVLAAAALGFMLLNWPFGRLFLGDGGAYFLGFSVAWIAVLLLFRHSQVSAWSSLLICAYPVLEVLFSMRRRSLRQHNIGHPDRLHLHSLVKRRLVRRCLPRGGQLMRNSSTGVLMWILALPAPLWGVSFYDNSPLLMLGLVLFALGYQALYRRLVRFRWFPLRYAQPVSPRSHAVSSSEP